VSSEWRIFKLEGRKSIFYTTYNFYNAEGFGKAASSNLESNFSQHLYSNMVIFMQKEVKMKFCRFLAGIFTLFMAFCALLPDIYAIEIDISSRTSNPEPGKNLIVEVNIINKANATNALIDKDNLEVDFVESSPFSLIRKSENIREPFNLKAGDSKKGTFYIYISPDARSYTYPLIFELKEGNIVTRKELMIEVKGFPDIVFDTTSSKKEIEPGEKFNLTLKFTNFGTGIANSIKIVQESTSFILLGDNLLYADKLDSKESKLMNMTFVTDDNAEPGSYLLPLKITYHDNERKQYNASQSIGIKVINKAKLNVRNVKLSGKGKEFDINLRLENVGLGDAKDVIAELKTPYRGFKKNFVGKLSPNEDLPLIFTLESGIKSHESILLVVTYSDDLGYNSFNETIEFDRLSGLALSSTLTYLVSAALLTGLFALIYLRRKRNAADHENKE